MTDVTVHYVVRTAPGVYYCLGCGAVLPSRQAANRHEEDASPVEQPRCTDRTGGGRYQCAKAAGHDGPHATYHPFVQWPREEED